MSRKAPPANANGHRRRQLRARVLATETHCALCGGLVDKSVQYIAGQHGPSCRRSDCTGCKWHPLSPVVDEDIPRSRGGSPYSVDNCHLMHRACNASKGTRTIAEYQQRNAPPTVTHTTNLVEW